MTTEKFSEKTFKTKLLGDSGAFPFVSSYSDLAAYMVLYIDDVLTNEEIKHKGYMFALLRNILQITLQESNFDMRSFIDKLQKNPTFQEALEKIKESTDNLTTEENQDSNNGPSSIIEG